MSMAGYILGLGDRHPSNLMLDRVSGRVVHIDFGDCFEITKQVPFTRLPSLTYRTPPPPSHTHIPHTLRLNTTSQTTRSAKISQRLCRSA